MIVAKVRKLSVKGVHEHADYRVGGEGCGAATRSFGIKPSKKPRIALTCRNKLTSWR
jgi:hypothetical protein